MQIFVITGTTGEHSDREKWVVEAQGDEKSAIARIAQLNKVMHEVGVDVYQPNDKEPVEAMRKHEFGDPLFRFDYPGTEYDYEPAQLRVPAV